MRGFPGPRRLLSLIASGGSLYTTFAIILNGWRSISVRLSALADKRVIRIGMTRRAGVSVELFILPSALKTIWSVKALEGVVAP